MKFAQSCDSRKCKSDNKDNIDKKICEAITTPHEVDFKTKTVKCLYCGKITKI